METQTPVQSTASLLAALEAASAGRHGSFAGMRHFKRCDKRLAIRQGKTKIAVDFFEDGTNNCPADPLFERAVGWKFEVDGKTFVADDLDGCPAGVTLYFQLEGTQDEEDEEDEDDFDVLSEGDSEDEGGGKQYWQNPNGRCEDAPCCGCCGYM